jgi:hypothetical protein
MRRFNLTMHGKPLIDADCSVVSFRARRGSIEQPTKHANFIKIPLRSLAAIDILNINVDTPIEVVFKKRIDARLLKDEVLE